MMDVLTVQEGAPEDTSAAAFQDAQPHFADNEFRVCRHLYNTGACTTDRMEVVLVLSHQTCSSRTSDLKKRGILFATEGRARTRSGSWAKLLDLTEFGRASLLAYALAKGISL